MPVGMGLLVSYWDSISISIEWIERHVGFSQICIHIIIQTLGMVYCAVFFRTKIRMRAKMNILMQYLVFCNALHSLYT